MLDRSRDESEDENGCELETEVRFPGQADQEVEAKSKELNKPDLHNLITYLREQIVFGEKFHFKNPTEAATKLNKLSEQLSLLDGLIAATGKRASYAKTEEDLNTLVRELLNGEVRYTEKDLEKKLEAMAARSLSQKVAAFFRGRTFLEILKVIAFGLGAAAIGAVVSPFMGIAVAKGATMCGLAGGGSVAAHSFWNRNPVGNQIRNLKGSLLELQGGPASDEQTQLLSTPSSSRK